jgi:hypothetical protein
MRKLAVLAVVPLAALALAAIASGGDTNSFKAKLNVKSEVPPATAPAKAAGSFKATVKESGYGSGGTLKWTLTFRNLSGPAAAANIHMAKPGTAGDVIVPLCGPCKTGAHGTAKVTRAVIAALEKGEAYVNVHTAKNAAGEIRGQITG